MLKPKSLKVFNEETNVNFYAWQIIIHGFFKSKLLKKFITYPKAQTAHFEGDHGRSAIELDSWNELGVKAMQFLHMRAWDLQKLLDYHYQTGEKIVALYETICKQNLHNASNKQYLTWFKNLWENFLELNGIGMVPVVSDYEHEQLSTELRNILQLHGVSEDKLLVYSTVLMSPTLPLSAWQEKLELLEIAKKYKTLAVALGAAEFEKHMEKYQWLNYGYQGPAMSQRRFETELEKIFTNKVPVLQQIKAHTNYFKELKTLQVKYIQQFKLSPKEQYLFRAAGVFTFAKGYRIDVRHRFHFISDKMFEALGERFSLPVKWFQFSERSEIEKLLLGKKPNTKAALQRAKKMLWVIEPGKEYFVQPRRIKDFYKKYIVEDKEVADSKELKGQPAFLGKVRGRAKIVQSVKDIHKVQHGDVLVAITTNPDFLPAMYRSIAFVTDTGGITSHAAIVSREMKKPCIIGTRFATKILKDGDYVEVDANIGVVKKLT